MWLCLYKYVYEKYAKSCMFFFYFFFAITDIPDVMVL